MKGSERETAWLTDTIYRVIRRSAYRVKTWKNEETCFHNCFLVLPCFHVARKHEMFLPCSRRKFCFLRPGKTRKHVSRNTRSARMFPQCFPVLPHGKHCFQRQFCFQEAKFASATRQKHFVFPRGMETWQNEETITEPCFWKHFSSFCQAFRNKSDAGNSASRVAKLGNIGETCARYGCF